ncbi:hypothetical protein LXL04_028082 [Taraxacum kok-saghyz]
MVQSANQSLYMAWASRNRWSEDLRYDCDEPATFSISRTDENPGRSFRGCPKFQEKSKKCDFFMWLDPPCPTSITKILCGSYTESSEADVGDASGYVRDVCCTVGGGEERLG